MSSPHSGPGPLRRPGGSDPGFAPSDLSDGRDRWQWGSAYRGAWRWIALEGAYLVAVLSASAAGLFLLWAGRAGAWLSVPPRQAPDFLVFGYAGLGGLMGGALFATKWLYHCVAKGIWNLDRAPWRYLSPAVSAGLGLAAVAVMYSVASSGRTRSMPGLNAFSVGFLVGFFSDNAVAKLAQVAKALFGDVGGTREPPASGGS